MASNNCDEKYGMSESFETTKSKNDEYELIFENILIVNKI